MNFPHIYNAGRFNQSADFSQVALQGTDVDFFVEVAGRAFIFVEFKSAGTGIPTGQRIAFTRLVEAAGQTVPSFQLLAEHRTNTTDAIHGGNSYVRTVTFRFPSMMRHEEYAFDEHMPSVNQWLSDFTLAFRLRQKLTLPRELWDGFPLVVDGPDGQPLVERPHGFWTHIQPILDAEGISVRRKP
jgi:hypothetical protein